MRGSLESSMRRRPHSHCPIHSGVTWSVSAICAWNRESSSRRRRSRMCNGTSVVVVVVVAVGFWFIGVSPFFVDLISTDAVMWCKKKAPCFGPGQNVVGWAERLPAMSCFRLQAGRVLPGGGSQGGPTGGYGDDNQSPVTVDVGEAELF